MIISLLKIKMNIFRDLSLVIQSIFHQKFIKISYFYSSMLILLLSNKNKYSKEI